MRKERNYESASFQGDDLVMVSDARRGQIVRVIYIAACLLFILSLLAPAASMSKNAFKLLDCAVPDQAPGWFFFLMGPLGVLVGQFGWFANPLMLVSAAPVGKSLKLLFAIFAVALAATSIGLSYLPNDIEGNAVCGFGPGLYLWLACSVLILIAAFLKPARQKNSSATGDRPHDQTS
jgi:hypothetical protein